MSKYKFYKNIQKDKIKAFLTKPVLGYFNEKIIKEEIVSLVIFSTDRNKVILSSHVRQFKKQNKELGTLVAVGMMFTVEAANLIRSLTPYFVYYDDNTWDDESYIRIKQNKSYL